MQSPIAFILLLGVSLLGAGCAGPSAVVESSAAQSQIYLDGRDTGARGQVTMPLPYYGSFLFANPAGQQHLEELQFLQVDEPFSPWLFPADFLLEFLSYPFTHEGYQHHLRLAPPPRQVLVPGVDPADLGTIRSRAMAARLKR